MFDKGKAFTSTTATRSHRHTSLFTSTKANRSHRQDVNDECGQPSMLNQIRTLATKKSVPEKAASLLKSNGLAVIEAV